MPDLLTAARLRSAMILALVGGGVAIGIAWGGQAAFVYGFFAVVMLAFTVGMAAFGRFMESASRGRFDRPDR
jgi:hypothetical protein